jgi:NADH:ubiquinone oxidoreductase subunit D
LGKRGDCYDRFLIRIREMFESINIICQVVNNVLINETSRSESNLNIFSLYNYLYFNNLNGDVKLTKNNNMETLIQHFKYYSIGLEIPAGYIYRSIEAPKGEFGVSIISDGSLNPYRCKFKSSAYNHLSILGKLSQGHMFADMITLLGSLDIVFGEIDR